MPFGQKKRSRKVDESFEKGSDDENGFDVEKGAITSSMLVDDGPQSSKTQDASIFDIKENILKALSSENDEVYQEEIPTIVRDKSYDKAEINFLQGDIILAKDLYEKCLEDNIAKKDEKDVTVQVLRNKIANCCDQLGEKAQAITYYEDCLKNLSQGALRTRVGMSLGQIYMESEEPEKALRCYSIAIPTSSHVSGNNSEIMRILVYSIYSYEQIAKAALKENKKVEALKHYVTTIDLLDIYYAHKGNLPNYFENDYVTVAKTSGDLFVATGDFENAIIFLKKVLNVVEKWNVESMSKKDQRNIATMYHNIGILSEKSGDIRVALDYYIKSIDIKHRVYSIKKSKDYHKKVGPTVLYIAFILYKLEKDEEALKYFKEVIDIFQAREAPSRYNDISSAFQAIAIIYVKQNQLDQAAASLEEKIQFMERCSSQPDSPLTAYKTEAAKCYRQIASLYFQLNDFEKAVDSYANAVEIMKDADKQDNKAMYKIHRKIASCYISLSLHEKAIEEYQECLQYANAEKKPSIHNMIGMLLGKANRHEDALEYYVAALNSIKDIRRYEVAVAVMNNAGNVYSKLGNDSEAMVQFKNALSTSEASGLSNERAIYQNFGIVYNIGLLHMKNAEYEEAIECFQEFLRSRVTANKMNENLLNEEIAFALSNVGNVKFYQTEYMDSIEFFGKSLAMKEQIYGGKSHKLALTMSNKGDAHSQMGQYGEALNYFESALKLIQNHPSVHEVPMETDLRVASLWIKIGNVHFKRKENDDAMNCYQKALQKKQVAFCNDENHPEVLLIRHNIALINVKFGELDKAYSQLDLICQKQASVSGYDSVIVAKLTLDMSGVLLKKHDFNRAKEMCESSLKYLNTQKLPSDHQFLRQAKYTMKKIKSRPRADVQFF